MKSILLTSTALVAFAGAAVAQESGITFTGDATLGYNTTDTVNDVNENEDFFWDSSIDVTLTSELDNGLVATATIGIDLSENNLGQTAVTDEFVITLSGENASLTFGDVDPVAESRFNGVDGEIVGFADQDAHFDTVGFESILVGEATFAGWTGAVSFGVDSGDDFNAGFESVDEVDALQIHIAGTVSIVDLEFAYQDEIGDVTDSVFGLVASTTAAGADLTVSYIDDESDSSLGFAVIPSGSSNSRSLLLH